MQVRAELALRKKREGEIKNSMTMSQTIRTARHRQAGAAQDVWQPCTGVGTGSFNCLSSLSLYPVAGNSLQERVERIEGSAIKDRRQLKI